MKVPAFFGGASGQSVASVCQEFRAFADAKEMEALPQEPAIYRCALRSIHVLLVEDDPEQALLTNVKVVDQTQPLFQVEWTDSLKSAMDRLTKPGIDVVLLDLGMDELTGYRTHLAIKTVAGRMPIVVLTADESSTSRDITNLMGAANYLIKQTASSVDIRHALWDAVTARNGSGSRQGTAAS
jgi:CheY-like chemotaxis protein